MEGPFRRFLERTATLDQLNELKTRALSNFVVVVVMFFAAPFFNHGVASVSQDCSLQTGGFVDLFDGSVWMAVSFLLTVEGETSFTTVKNASVILVHCIAVCMITIHIVGLSWG